MSGACARAMDLEVVLKVLHEYDGCSKEARKVLTAGLPKAIGQEGGADRHEFQNRFLTSTQIVLNEAAKVASDKTAIAQQEIQTAKQELGSRQASRSEAAKKEEEARADAEKKASLLTAAKEYVLRTERDHKKVEDVKARFCKERDQLKQDKAQHSSMADGSLRILLEGGWEDEELKAAVLQPVQEHLRKITGDEVLIAAAASALGTKPENRHAFDKLTVEHIVEAFDAQSKKFSDRLAEGDLEEEEQRAYALGMWAVADCARDAQQSAVDESQAADQQLETLIAATQAEVNKVTEQEMVVVSVKSTNVLATEKRVQTEEAIQALDRLIMGAYESKIAEVEPVGDAMVVDEVAESAHDVEMTSAPGKAEVPVASDPALYVPLGA